MTKRISIGSHQKCHKRGKLIYKISMSATLLIALIVNILIIVIVQDGEIKGKDGNKNETDLELLGLGNLYAYLSIKSLFISLRFLAMFLCFRAFIMHYTVKQLAK